MSPHGSSWVQLGPNGSKVKTLILKMLRKTVGTKDSLPRDQDINYRHARRVKGIGAYPAKVRFDTETGEVLCVSVKWRS